MLSLPFCRTPIKIFETNVAVVEQACGHKGYLTLSELAKVFNSPAWAALTSNDSKLVKVLTSKAFKDESSGQRGDQIDKTYFMCYGLLLCSGTPKEKAEVFYGILQEGGLTAHSFISAQDKDLQPVFEKLCLFSTVHLFEFARDLTGVDCPYEDHFDKLAEAHESLREDVFLDDVYGVNSKLDNEAWLSGVIKKGSWVFDSKQLRTKVFA